MALKSSAISAGADAIRARSFSRLRGRLTCLIVVALLVGMWAPLVPALASEVPPQAGGPALEASLAAASDASAGELAAGVSDTRNIAAPADETTVPVTSVEVYANPADQPAADLSSGDAPSVDMSNQLAGHVVTVDGGALSAEPNQSGQASAEPDLSSDSQVPSGPAEDSDSQTSAGPAAPADSQTLAAPVAPADAQAPADSATPFDPTASPTTPAAPTDTQIPSDPAAPVSASDSVPATFTYPGIGFALGLDPDLGEVIPEGMLDFAIAAAPGSADEARADAKLSEADRAFSNPAPDADGIARFDRLTGITFDAADVDATFEYVLTLRANRVGYEQQEDMLQLAITPRLDAETNELYTVTVCTVNYGGAPVVRTYDSRDAQNPRFVMDAPDLFYPAKLDASAIPDLLARAELAGRDIRPGDFTCLVMLGDMEPDEFFALGVGANGADGSFSFPATDERPTGFDWDGFDAFYLEMFAQTGSHGITQFTTEEGFDAWDVPLTAYELAAADDVTGTLTEVHFSATLVNVGSELQLTYNYPEGGITFKNICNQGVLGDVIPLSFGVALEGATLQPGQFSFTMTPRGSAPGTTAEEAAAKLTEANAHLTNGAGDEASAMPLLTEFPFTSADIGKSYLYQLTQDIPASATNPTLAEVFPELAGMDYGQVSELASSADADITQRMAATNALSLDGWRADGIAYDASRSTVNVYVGDDGGMPQPGVTVMTYRYAPDESGKYGLVKQEQHFSAGDVPGTSVLTYHNRVADPAPVPTLSYGGLDVELRLTGSDLREGMFSLAIRADEDAPNAAEADARLSDSDRTFANAAPSTVTTGYAVMHRLGGLVFGPQDVGTTFAYLVSLTSEPGPGYEYRSRTERVSITVCQDEDGELYTLTTVTCDGETQEFDSHVEGGGVARVDLRVRYTARFTEATSPSVVAGVELAGRNLAEGELRFGITTQSEAHPDQVEPWVTGTNAADGTVRFEPFNVDEIDSFFFAVFAHIDESIHPIVTPEGKRGWTADLQAYQLGELPEGVTAEVDSVDFTLTAIDNGDGTMSSSIDYPQGGIVFKYAYAGIVKPDPDDPDKPADPDEPADPNQPTQPGDNKNPSPSGKPGATKPTPQIPKTADASAPAEAPVALALGGAALLAAGGALAVRTSRRRA